MILLTFNPEETTTLLGGASSNKLGEEMKRQERKQEEKKVNKKNLKGEKETKYQDRKEAKELKGTASHPTLCCCLLLLHQITLITTTLCLIEQCHNGKEMERRKIAVETEQKKRKNSCGNERDEVSKGYMN